MLENLTNKQFAFECMSILLRNNVPVEKLYCLTDGDYCKEKLACRKPILKQVNKKHDISQEVIYDYTKQARFYKKVFDYNGVYFLITNYWYGANTHQPDNRTPFINWVNSQCEFYGTKT